MSSNVSLIIVVPILIVAFIVAAVFISFIGTYIKARLNGSICESRRGCRIVKYGFPSCPASAGESTEIKLICFFLA